MASSTVLHSTRRKPFDASVFMETTLAIDPKTIIHVDPEIMGGTPCFKGTRVPIKNLFDYLETGETLESFFEGFPRVTQEQVEGVLELARHSLLESL